MTEPANRAGRTWKLYAWIAGLTAVFIAVGFAFDKYDKRLVSSAGPHEGYYWTVAQYQVALLRVREELRAAAAGATTDPEELALRGAILASRAKILTDPSEITSFFRQVPEYEKASRAIAEFTSTVAPELEAKRVTPERARAMLADVEKIDAIVVRLANDVRGEEIRGREATRKGLTRHRFWLWSAMSIAWASLVVWLVIIARSRIRHRQASRDRQAALESEQKAVASMKDAIRAKTEFVGMVSHELRSPLQSILSALDIIEMRRQTQAGSADVGEFVSRVRRAATALDAQLRDLLTLARGETGHLEMRPEPFEAVTLIEDIVEVWRAEAQRKDLQLEFTKPDGPVFVVADPVRIAQVVSNLVGNAVKYTAAGSVRLALDGPTLADQTLKVAVGDTGPGIPKEFLPLIFGAYRRFAPIDGQKQGAGIGLAIVRTVVEHLGGTVSVDSREGEGTEFQLTIPVVEVNDSPLAERSSSGHRLLVVDDRRDVLEGLCAVARELGYECDEADSAAVAGNLLAARQYDTVLIDLDMPIKTGQELASAIRRIEGINSKTRLLAMSAAECESVGRSWPFDGFLAKPVDRHTLAAAIKRPGVLNLH